MSDFLTSLATVLFAALIIWCWWLTYRMLRLDREVFPYHFVKCEGCNGEGWCPGMMPEDGSEICGTCYGAGWRKVPGKEGE